MKIFTYVLLGLILPLNVMAVLSQPEPQSSPFWKNRFEWLSNQDYAQSDTVFIGDSITEAWSYQGKSAWDSSFVKFRPVNMGFNSDKIENVVWRIENSDFNSMKLSPKVAVLLIGTNNLSTVGSNEDLGQGVANLASRLTRAFPGVKVLVLSLLPRQQDQRLLRRISDINLIIDSEIQGRVDQGSQISYLSVWNEFFNSELNQLKSELYEVDLIHLNEAGYRVLGKALKPVISRLIYSF